MNCPKCNGTLYIAGSKFVSDVGTTDVHSELTMVCNNPQCDNYAGADWNNPNVVVQTIRDKVN